MAVECEPQAASGAGEVGPGTELGGSVAILEGVG